LTAIAVLVDRALQQCREGEIFFVRKVTVHNLVDEPLNQWPPARWSPDFCHYFDPTPGAQREHEVPVYALVPVDALMQRWEIKDWPTTN
jgi:hypothetical protein